MLAVADLQASALTRVDGGGDFRTRRFQANGIRCCFPTKSPPAAITPTVSHSEISYAAKSIHLQLGLLPGEKVASVTADLKPA
jgi:hypothetical protein